MLSELRRITASAFGAKGNDIPKAIRYPRPTDPPKAIPPPASRAELHQRFNVRR